MGELGLGHAMPPGRAWPSGPSPSWSADLITAGRARLAPRHYGERYAVWRAARGAAPTLMTGSLATCRRSAETPTRPRPPTSAWIRV
jgi:hypothetical protein